MAGAHTIAASCNFTFSNDTHYMLQSDDILAEPLRIINGKILLSDKPGLGIEVDERKLFELSKTDIRESVFFDSIDDQNMPYIGQII